VDYFTYWNQERRILRDPSRALLIFTIKAQRIYSLNLGRDPLVDFVVIMATITPDLPVASTATCSDRDRDNKCILLRLIAWPVLVFLYGMSTAAAYIYSPGRYKKELLLIGTDKMSALYTDRACIIFGDGASAVQHRTSFEGYGLQDMVVEPDGSGRGLVKLVVLYCLHIAGNCGR
jgi:3-oxoacyl-[acyl-carrier-protein] synthase-3